MPAPYTKPHLELPDQVGLLASRGLVIPDPQYAERVLRAVGYYRLSGYWYPYRKPSPTGVGRSDDLVPGTSLDQVVHLYDFDRRLKLHLLNALERIEIAARVQVGHVLGRRGAYAHLDPTNLDARFAQPPPSGESSRYQEWLRRMYGAQELSRVFGPLCLVLFLLAETVEDDAWERWRDDLVHLLTQALSPTGRTLSEMGFPQAWQTLSLWR